MEDLIVWAIVIGFYAPLHYLLPVLVLFITGNETDEVRRRLIKGALVDSTWSMLIAFAVAIYLADAGRLPLAMSGLLLSMLLPFARIWLHRREIA